MAETELNVNGLNVGGGIQTVNTRNLKVGSVDVRVALYEDETATMENAVSIGRLTGVSARYTGERVTYEADNGEDIDGGLANEQYEVNASEWTNIDLEILHVLTGEVGTYTYTPANGDTPASQTLTIGGGGAPKPLHMWLVNTQASGKRFVVEIYNCTSIASVELSYGADKAKTLIKMPVSIIGKPDPKRPAGDQLFKIIDEVTLPTPSGT